MSRSSTTTKSTQSATAPQTSTAPACIPMDKIAMRAYQKWLMGGCMHGNDQKDWLEAEAELKAEMAKGGVRR